MKATGLVFNEKPSIGIEPTRLYDRSRFGNHGTHTDVTTVQRPSGLWVRSFNGSSSKIVIPDAPSLSFGNGVTDSPFSILSWVNMTDADGFAVAAKMDGTSREYVFSTTGSETLYAAIYDLNNANFHSIVSDDAITAYEGRDILVTLTYDSSGLNTGLELYLNGVLLSVTRGTTGTYVAMHDTAADLWIGAAKYPTPGYANGRIALPKIYNYALSAGQVKKIFEAERHFFGV